MSSKTGSTIRLDPELRKELSEGLASVGLTINGYFTMAAKQFIIQGKVPFEIQATPKTETVHFNEKTRKAIVRAYAEEEGIIPNTAKTFDNTDDAMEELFNEK
jgi:DNA-damage-inducible protein J